MKLRFVTSFHWTGAVCEAGTTYRTGVLTSSKVYGVLPLISTFSKRATPDASVTAYSSTARPDRDVPYRWNVISSTKLSSDVLTTSKEPRLSLLLKVTVEVCPLTIVTFWDFWGSYLSMSCSVTV